MTAWTDAKLSDIAKATAVGWERVKSRAIRLLLVNASVSCILPHLLRGKKGESLRGENSDYVENWRRVRDVEENGGSIQGLPFLLTLYRLTITMRPPSGRLR